MRIAYILPVFPALSETFILNQITGLMDLGHDIDIYSLMEPAYEPIHADVVKYGLIQKTCYLKIAPENYLIRGLEALKIIGQNIRTRPSSLIAPLNFFRFGRQALNLRKLFQIKPFLGKSYDILQCHFGPTGFFGVQLKRLGVAGKLITMFHGYDIRMCYEKPPIYYDELFSEGDLFLGNTLYTCRELLKLGAESTKVKHHPVGIDTNKFKRRNPVRKKEKVITMLSVARCVKEKGLEYGIRAMRLLYEKKPENHFKYIIIGDGPLRGSLKKLAKELCIEKQIHFWGGCTQEKIIDAMECADIFLLPSVEETFGVVLLEAQAMALPILASDVGGVKEAFVNGRTGYVFPPQNPEATFQSISNLIDNRHTWEAMGAAGREFVVENFDIAKINSSLQNKYGNLLVQSLS